MESYRAWFGEGPELSVLRMLGLFDRPADEKALGALLSRPAINGLTESLTNLSPTEWQTILARLRRARLLARKDPHNPGHLDTHPLVREYFGEQLRSQRTQAWKEGNRRLYRYYRTLAPQLPDSFREMEPLFLAVICGCNAGLFHEALREVYIPRIQRGDAFFAAKVLGARGALLSVLVHFFEHGRWGSPVEKGVEGQSLTAEDQLDGSLSRFGMHALFLGRFRDRATIRDAPQRCGWILRQIGHLYRIEDTLRRSRAGPKKRAAVRMSQSRPICQRLHRALVLFKKSRRYLPRSAFGQAIDYALFNWPLLGVYLENGRIQIDNNLVENSIRPTALGKKNWLFFGDADAGQRSAILYTIIESCRCRGIDPHAYLRSVLTRLPSMTNWQVKDITPEAWAKTSRSPATATAA